MAAVNHMAGGNQSEIRDTPVGFSGVVFSLWLAAANVSVH